MDQVEELRKSIDELTHAIRDGRPISPQTTTPLSSQSVSPDEASLLQKKYGIGPQVLQSQGISVAQPQVAAGNAPPPGPPPAPSFSAVGPALKSVLPPPVQQSGGSLPPNVPPTKPPVAQPAPSQPFPPRQASQGFEALAGKMKSFGLSLVSVGSVLKGLQGTREGYQLNYSLNHLFFEIADLLRDPIRIITRELEGFANVIHAVNASGDKANGIGPMNVLAPEIKVFKQLWNISQGKKDIDAPTPHNQPILHTSFGDVQGLQNRLQALSTENPAQARGLSLIESIYNVLVSINNSLPGSDKLTPIAVPKND